MKFRHHSTGLLARKLNGYERKVLIAILKKVRGNVQAASRVAGRNRTEFYRLLNRHGLKPQEYRQ